MYAGLGESDTEGEPEANETCLMANEEVRDVDLISSLHSKSKNDLIAIIKSLSEEISSLSVDLEDKDETTENSGWANKLKDLETSIPKKIACKNCKELNDKVLALETDNNVV